MRFNPVLGAAALALGLAGCQTMSDVGNVFSSSSKSEPAVTTAPTAETSAAPVVAGAPIAGASSFTGVSAEALRDAWGEPSLKRNETGVELWQYASSSCTLLMYLYPGSNSALTVSRAEAVPGGSDDAAVATCAKAAGKPPLKPVS